MKMKAGNSRVGFKLGNYVIMPSGNEGVFTGIDGKGMKIPKFLKYFLMEERAGEYHLNVGIVVKTGSILSFKSELSGTVTRNAYDQWQLENKALPEITEQELHDNCFEQSEFERYCKLFDYHPTKMST